MPKPPKPPDLTDRLADGTLPDDLTADTVPMDPPPPGLPESLGDLLPGAITRMRRRQSGDESPIPLPWRTVADALGGGLWPATLNILVGNPGVGKTQFCLQVALAAAKAGTPVLYVALEADKLEFAARCLGLEANVPWNALFHGRHDGLARLIEKHAPTLAPLPLHVALPTARGWNYTGLTAAAAALREKYPDVPTGARPMLVVVDFLQIVGAADPHEDFRTRIGNAANVAATVARDHNAAVILASSTARANYEKVSGDDKEPLGDGSPVRLLGLGKDSGDIEYAAWTVLVLARDWLAVAKVRGGEPQWVPLLFNGHRFTEPLGSKTPLRGTPTR